MWWVVMIAACVAEWVALFQGKAELVLPAAGIGLLCLHHIEVIDKLDLMAAEK